MLIFHSDQCLSLLFIFIYRHQLHEDKCLFKLLPCENEGCVEQVMRSRHLQHMTMSCEWREVRCIYCNETYTWVRSKVRTMICVRNHFTHTYECQFILLPLYFSLHRSTEANVLTIHCLVSTAVVKMEFQEMRWMSNSLSLAFRCRDGCVKARLHMRFLMRFLMRFRIQNAPYPTLHERRFREA